MTVSNAELIKEYTEKLIRAEDDIPFDQHGVAMFYYFGIGVAQNKIFAYKWFMIFESNYLSGKGYRNIGKGMMNIIAKDMTPEEIVEAKKLAKEWIKINRDDWHENEMKKLQQDKP